MIRNGIISFHIIFLLLPVPVRAAAYDSILSGMTPSSITIIGESHQHKESPEFIGNLVDAKLNQNSCLILALEIEDSQQPIIDKVMQGRAQVSEITITPMIDHPSVEGNSDR
ncbi:MAG: hypothetical protein HOO92_01530 [Methylococcaceae bacterium]|nr:hypothetical protein [Methylococcaceae bacterium]